MSTIFTAENPQQGVVLYSRRKEFNFNSREVIAAIIRDIVLFLIRRLHRWFLQTDLLELSFSIQVISIALQLKCVCVTSFFLLLGQLRGLPYQKNNF